MDQRHFCQLTKELGVTIQERQEICRILQEDDYAAPFPLKGSRHGHVQSYTLLMALDGIVTSVNNWLKQQHVVVLNEWVQACIQWLDSQYQDGLPDTSEIQQLVYEQWLDSDLADVGAPCVPNGIGQQQKGFLTGNHILQINSLRDVSTPAYSQLVKLRGKENENAKVTATQPQDRFEPKSNRMLMLQLTDGHQTIQGMEFIPIPQLRVNTAPGTKILVSGSVKCRLGVLMLSAKNVQILGGEVDALAEDNNQDAVLAQVLGQPTIPVDQQVNHATQQDETMQQQDQHQQQQQQQQQRNHVIDLTDDQSMNHTSSGTKQPTQNTRPQPQQRHQPPPSRIVQEEDAFMDDFDDDDGFDEMMLQELEEIELQQQEQDSKTSNESAHHHGQQQQPFQRTTSQAGNSNTAFNSSTKSEAKVNPTTNNYNPQTNQRQPRPFLGQSQQQQNPHTGFHGNQGNTNSFLGNRGNTSDPSNVVQKPNIAVAARIKKEQTPVERLENQTHTYQASSVQNRTNSAPQRSFLRASNQEPQSANQDSATRQGFVKYEANRTTTTPSAFNRFPNETNMKTEPDITTPASSSSATGGFNHSVNRNIVKTEPATNSTFQSSTMPSTSSGFQPASAVVKQEHGPSRAAVKNEGSVFGGNAQRSSVGSMNTAESSEDESVAAKRRRFFSGQNSSGDIDSNLPYSCLSVVERKQAARENFVISVKGFIMTLVSSLTHKGGWSVTAKINDGTASVDVDFGSEVLTRLIGFSVKDLVQMKKAAMRASGEKQAETKRQMREGLEKCQAALVDMSCIMTLEIHPSYERPRVITIRDVNEGDCLTLIHQL